MISKTKVIGFLKMSKDEKKMSICRNTYRLLHKKSFFSIGKRSYIYKPIHLAGSKYISMGDDVGIWNNARIEIIDKWHDQRFSPRLAIGNNVNIGQDLHLTVAESVEIQDGVVCSGRVTITDINHVTDDPDSPVLEQGIATKPVKICEGAFIGINSVIMPGVTVGRHAIVGSNSVVTKSVPDYTTVVGAPARIIKQK